LDGFNPLWVRERKIEKQMNRFSALYYAHEYVKGRVLNGLKEGTSFEKELIEALMKSEKNTLRCTTVI
jgi:hypothetical protein